MGDESSRGPSHNLLLALEAGRVLELHETLRTTPGIEEVTWFVVDLGGILGRFCGDEIIGPAIVEHRLGWAARNGLRPSMCFPLDGPGGLIAVEQLAPGLMRSVQTRLAGDVAIVILDHEDVAALAWLHELQRSPGRT